MEKVIKNQIEKPECYKKPQCIFCGRQLELRFGGCYDCADLQAILINGTDMNDNDFSDWNKSEILAHIIRKVMKY